MPYPQIPPSLLIPMQTTRQRIVGECIQTRQATPDKPGYGLFCMSAIVAEMTAAEFETAFGQAPLPTSKYFYWVSFD